MGDPFVTFENSPRNVISGIGYIGIRYIRFALNPVWDKKPKGDPLAPNDFVATLKILKIESGDPFVTFKNSPRNVVSGIRCIRNSLFPVWIKCGMGCVIVEGDSLALFTVQM